MGPLVVLVGAPGAGKSTVAALVATALGATHLDTDTMVETQTGSSISDIFISHGETEFRKLERDAVAQALQTSDTVVSLGGGAVIDPHTRAALQQHPVVWLQVSLSDAASRAGMNQARPLLLGNVRATLARLLDERTPWYEEVCDVAIDTSSMDADEVAARITEWLRRDAVAS